MKTEEGKLEARQDQLDIAADMKSTLTNAIIEAYKYGYNDGYSCIYNEEFVGTNKSKLLPIEGEESVVSMLLKKYFV